MGRINREYLKKLKKCINIDNWIVLALNCIVILFIDIFCQNFYSHSHEQFLDHIFQKNCYGIIICLFITGIISYFGDGVMIYHYVHKSIKGNGKGHNMKCFSYIELLSTPVQYLITDLGIIITGLTILGIGNLNESTIRLISRFLNAIVLISFEVMISESQSILSNSLDKKMSDFVSVNRIRKANRR